jgi:hypothetical protein
MKQMLADMEQADSLYKPTRFWRDAIDAVRSDIELFGIENFYAHPSAATHYAPEHPHPSLEEQFRTFQEHDSDSHPNLSGYSQSLFGRPHNPYVVDGRHYSGTSLNYLRGLAFLKKHLPTEGIETVIEIGGGFGALGEILLQGGVKRYINIDIPPLAAVSTAYLASQFETLDYSQTREMETIPLDGDWRAMVLCPWQLPRVTGQADLGVNYISFQEMEPHVVENYAAHLARLCPGPLLLRNSAQGKSNVDRVSTREDYLRIFAPRQLIASDVETFGDAYLELDSEVLILS